jgi:hypothetical protein
MIMERKEIIKALSDHFAVKPIYFGAPSFAYQIETVLGTYSIDRVGKITSEKGVEVDLDSLLAGSAVVEQDEPLEPLEPLEPVDQTDQTDQTESDAPVEPAALSNVAFEVAVPLEDHTGLTLRNLVNLVNSKQVLIRKSLGITEVIIEEDFVTAINKANIDNLENFKTAIDGIGEKYCPGITFNFDSGIIIFRFFHVEQNAEKIHAYTQFVELLDQTAKTLKYTSAKAYNTDNDKFTFRLFLIKLGMIGTGYKTTRKVLLEKLEGNSAFRNGSKPEKNTAEPAEV